MTAMSGPLLRVDELTVDFRSRRGTVRAVRGVSLDVAAGECVALIGESGSGKSATARALIGLVGPTARVHAGRHEFEGQDLSRATRAQWRQLRGARIGFVLQDALTSLDPLRRVGDEVREPLDLHQTVARSLRGRRVLELLGEVGIPDPGTRARQHPHQLSGGLRQRALIASAIAAGPSLLIADEPTTALDVTVQAQILDLLADRRALGTGIVLISHDLAVVARTADRVAVMYAGLIVEQGLAAHVLSAAAHPYTAELLAAVPALGQRGNMPAVRPWSPPHTGPGCPYAGRCARADDRCARELPGLTQYADSQVRCWHPGSRTDNGTVRRERSPACADESRGPVISVEGISKRFRSPDGEPRTVVADVAFSLQAGEALGIVGESGSGKTTTARIVMATLAPDSGTVRLDGKPWSELSERARRPLRPRIQMIHQDPLSSFDPRFTVSRIIGEALATGEALGGGGRLDARAQEARIAGLLDRVGLAPGFAARRPRDLSGGERQRVAIARALATNPDVLVCDEPVSALDVSIQAQVLDLFARVRAELGLALLFISHDLGVIEQVCDRVVVMKEGSVVESGDVLDVFSRPKHPYTQALLDAVPRLPPATASNGLPAPAQADT